MNRALKPPELPAAADPARVVTSPALVTTRIAVLSEINRRRDTWSKQVYIGEMKEAIVELPSPHALVPFPASVVTAPAGVMTLMRKFKESAMYAEKAGPKTPLLSTDTP
jgi:hypothetical protein